MARPVLWRNGRFAIAAREGHGGLGAGARMGPLLATGCTVKLCVTGGAAPKDASPGCETVMEHVPTPMMVTVVPAIVQTAGVVDAKLTASPEVAVAVRVNGATTKVTSLNAPNVVVLDADDPIK